MRANSPTNSEMEFITISTLGNGADFGDTHLQQGGAGGASNAVRGIFAGGYKSPATSYNNISYITIATLGDSKDFGDLTYSSGELGLDVQVQLEFMGHKIISRKWKNK